MLPRVREAEPRDAPGLARLAAQLADSDDTRAVRSRLQELLADSEHLVAVAEIGDDEVVGWIHAFVARRLQTDPFVEIGGFVVTPGHRRIGVGSALCRRVELWAEELGLARIRVRSQTDRAEAAAFFETAGFGHTKIQRVFDRAVKPEDPGAT